MNFDDVFVAEVVPFFAVAVDDHLSSEVEIWDVFVESEKVEIVLKVVHVDHDVPIVLAL